MIPILLTLMSLSAEPRLLMLIDVPADKQALLYLNPNRYIQEHLRRLDDRPPGLQAFDICTTRDRVIQPDPLCRRLADLDGDTDVDMNDFGLLQRSK